MDSTNETAQVWCDRLESEGVDTAMIVAALLRKNKIRIVSVSTEHVTEPVRASGREFTFVRSEESTVTDQIECRGSNAEFLGRVIMFTYEWKSVVDATPRH